MRRIRRAPPWVFSACQDAGRHASGHRQSGGGIIRIIRCEVAVPAAKKPVPLDVRQRISASHKAQREPFWSRVVETESGCWEWQGQRSPRSGHGLVRTGSRIDGTRTRVYAHRMAYELAVGPIPDGACVLHHCDNPPCVRADIDPNVSHLFLGSRRDNVLDMDAKGRRNRLGAYSILPAAPRDAQPKRRTAHQRGERHHNAKLTAQQVREIRASYANDGTPMRTLAHQYSVCKRTISLVVRGLTYQDIAESS